ncbi:hypothetical protein AVEN_114891-1 [Araneus ventricosus]|uniref:Uncharacterized protein n=1 Tax=Araneus ventricosus TaxID=182803 RepID=A0A4Y2S759_ARAVE|nr:hypothetical protein AVEN_114891-1 [Araneus ventricosus]
MLLSQFMSGLKQAIKAPVIVHDPSSFKEAVEFDIRVEKSQNLVCPNINAINTSQESELQKLKNQQSECSSKMELLVLCSMSSYQNCRVQVKISIQAGKLVPKTIDK